MPDPIDRLREALADRYAIEDMLGEGGMAVVYLANDLKHRRRVAIKLLRPEIAAGIGSDRFIREIEIAARLQHPHVLPVYDSGEVDGILYYVMPYVEGESLRDRLDGQLPPREALHIARDVASALDYAHRQGVVHRDIKPANILLSEGHAVVADFGIARAASGSGETQGLTQAGMAVGTPWYMSPEQAMGEPNIDGRTDIYALGCVLFEMLSGKPPYQGDTAQAVIAKTISAPVPEMGAVAGGLPETVPTAIKRALAKDPHERFPTAAEFGTALETETGESGGGRRGKRNTAALITTAGAVIALAVVAWIGLRSPEGVVASGGDVIAVLPFDVSGASEELGEGMVSLLSTNLNAVGALRTIDARTVLQRWRKRGGEEGLDLEGSLQVGRDVQAGSILLGSVVEAGSEVRLSAEMYAVNGDELVRVQIDGDANEVLALVDSLSINVLRGIWRSNEPLPSFDVAAISSGSLEAIRAYMKGALYFRRGQWDSAAASFEKAVSVDSTFALAHLALSETYGWTGRHGDVEQAHASDAAARFADRLPPRERLLVTGYALNRRGDFTSIDTLKLYTRRYPSDARGWYALGDIQYHALAHFPLGPEEQLAPFDRAINLDSSYVVAFIHPMETTLSNGDRAAFRRYLALNEEAGGSDRGYPLIEAIVWGDSSAAEAAVDSLVRTPDLNTLLLAGGVAVRVSAHAVRRVADGFDRLGNRNPQLSTPANYLGGLFLIALGQPSALGELATAMLNETRSGAGLSVLAAVAGVSDASAAAPAVEWIRANRPPQWAAVIEAVLLLAGGKPEEARGMIPGVPLPADTLRHWYRGISGWASLIEGDTTRGIRELRASTDSIPSDQLGSTQIADPFRVQLALALARRPENQDEGVRRLRYGFRLPTAVEMYPQVLLSLAESLEAAGDYAGAAEAYADFVELWSMADEELQPRVEAARRALERLTRER
jgi:serine/threonine-protein kinase